MTRTWTIEDIHPRDLVHLDLRREAVQALYITPLPDLADDDIAEELGELPSVDAIMLDHRSRDGDYGVPAILAYRITIDEEASAAEALVVTATGRIGIAWGADAQWGDLRDDPTISLRTVEGGDTYAAALAAAIRDWMTDAEAWEARA